MNEFLISFDDTDNLETKGTGHVLARFLGGLPCEVGYITRHQLFVSDLVPYTSHNSAMCANVQSDMSFDDLVERAEAFLESESAPGSDPGLCVADTHAVYDLGALVEWGRRAKMEVLQKADAYDLAGPCGVHLSEHGGDGQGVVGALAAVGLRLSGNDGRIRGKVNVEAERMTVAELVAATGFDRVCAYGIGQLADDCIIETGGEAVKAAYQDFQRTILVEPADAVYKLMDKRHLKRY